ncbi:hypothetical protein OQA88_10721 [Cercophora sp. LCS_1]
MPQITEIAWFPLRSGHETTEAGAALRNLAPQLRAQPGLVSAWHGNPLERPQSGEFVNVWDSEESYKASESSPLKAQATKLVGELLDASEPSLKPYHNAVPFSKPFETVAAAPVVQVSSFFLPADVDKAAFEAAFDSVLKAVYGNPPDGFVVGAHGWALESVNGAKVFATISGWQSIEKRVAAHAGIAEKFAEIQKFTNVVEVHHTSFKRRE